MKYKVKYLCSGNIYIIKSLFSGLWHRSLLEAWVYNNCTQHEPIMQKLILRFCPIFLCQKGVGYTVYTCFHFRGKIINRVEHSIQENWQAYFQKLQRCMKLHNWIVLYLLCWYLLWACTQLKHPTIHILVWESSQNWNISRFFLFSSKKGTDFCFLTSLQTALWASTSQHAQSAFQRKCTSLILATLVTVKLALFVILHISKVPSTPFSGCSYASLCIWTAAACNFQKIPSFFLISPNSPIKTSSPFWQMPHH